MSERESLIEARDKDYLADLRFRAEDRISNYGGGGMGVNPRTVIYLLDALESLGNAEHALRHLYPRPFAPEKLLNEEESWRREVVKAGLSEGPHPCRHGKQPCPCSKAWTE